MTPKISKNNWSGEAFFEKAKLYISVMEKHKKDEWQFGFWSALALEHLARASLAHISPALLASKPKNDDWKFIAYALGVKDIRYEDNQKMSISFNQVMARLLTIIKDFKDHESFCKQHIQRRNKELHSGEVVFNGIEIQDWLQEFYSVCEVLLISMNKDIEDLFSDSNKVRNSLEAFNKDLSSAVNLKINHFKSEWTQKSKKVREDLHNVASEWSDPTKGHRVDCPSCNSKALIFGIQGRELSSDIKDDKIVKTYSMTPSSFECRACGLKLTGRNRLQPCNLGDEFTLTDKIPVTEFFTNLYTKDELEEEIEQRISELDPGDLYDPYFND